MSRQQIKRQTDLQILSAWIQQDQRVLDIGCGRGVLLEHLMRTLSVNALGVDIDLDKVQSCIKRGVPVYHGDADALLREFPDQFYDWIILSRTLQELSEPQNLLQEALRVGRNVAVGFVNYGFYLNRWSTLLTGTRPVNEVFPQPWQSSSPSNPVTIKAFNDFIAQSGYHVVHAVFLKGDWVRETRWCPNLTAGYALYHLSNPTS